MRAAINTANTFMFLSPTRKKHSFDLTFIDFLGESNVGTIKDWGQAVILSTMEAADHIMITGKKKKTYLRS